MFNIMYIVTIRLIKYERFSTNDEKYLNLVHGMRGSTFEVSNYSTLSSFKTKRNPPDLGQLPK